MCWGRRLPSSEKFAKPWRTLRNLLQILLILIDMYLSVDSEDLIGQTEKV